MSCKFQLHIFLLFSAVSLQDVLCGDYCGSQNFMDLDTIRKKSPYCFNEFPDTVQPVKKGLYLMPEMNFTCSGVIKRILVGARIDSFSNDQSYPSLQIWRQKHSDEDEENSETKTNERSFSRKIRATLQTPVTMVSSHTIEISKDSYSPSQHLYYEFQEPIEFKQGDFLGFYQPSNESSVSIFYTTETYIQPQTVYVDASANIDDNTTAIDSALLLGDLKTMDEHYLLLRPQTDVGSICMMGFLDYGEVKTRSKFINQLKYNNKELRLFPDIKCNCPVGQAYITAITFGAQTRNGENNMLLPELQIWRPEAINSYVKVHSIRLSKNETRTSNVHELYLDPPVEFKNQDFIGLFQPEVEESELVLFYQETSGPKNLIVARDIDQSSPTAVSGLNNSEGNDYPLVAVKIAALSASSIIPSSTNDVSNTNEAYTSTASTFPSTTQSTVPPSDSNTIIIILSIAIGIIVLVFMIVIAVIVAIIMCIKVRQQKMSAQQQPNSASSPAVATRHPDSKKLTEARNAAGLTMSHHYEECVDMERNFSYGVFAARDIKTALNPSYNGKSFSSSQRSRESYVSVDDYEDYPQEYVLPMPMSPLDDDSLSHKYY